MRLHARFLLLAAIFAFATSIFGQAADFQAIDNHARAVGFAPLEELAELITAPCKTDLEKVRAIFVWETEHIVYDTERLRQGKLSYMEDLDNSAQINNKVYTFQLAKYVLEQKKALCGGYARLFKALCELSDIRCEVVLGYSFTKADFDETKRVIDHGWNAVLLDEQWQLLDVTWASGAANMDGFTKKFNPFYFLTPPEKFIYNHYPEEAKWALLKKMPTLEAFFSTPVRYAGLSNLKISAFGPGKGILEAAVGDTILFTLTTTEVEKHLDIEEATGTADQMDDQGFTSKNLSYFCAIEGDKIRCKYIVRSRKVKFLHLFLNDQLILAYRLKVSP